MGFKSILAWPQFSAVNAHVARHQPILAIIQASVPLQLKTQIMDCVVNNRQLIIYTRSAIWASQLRFYSDKIQAEVNLKTKEHINRTKVRLLPPEAVKKDKISKKIIPSENNIRLIRNNANSLGEGKLQTALLRLSTALERQKKTK